METATDEKIDELRDKLECSTVENITVDGEVVEVEASYNEASGESVSDETDEMELEEFEDSPCESSQRASSQKMPTFRGHHAIRFDHDGTCRPTTVGSYMHVPTETHVDDSQSELSAQTTSDEVVYFEAECPNPTQLIDKVQSAISNEEPTEAARAEYRRSRL